jgi:hypothetical protein
LQPIKKIIENNKGTLSRYHWLLGNNKSENENLVKQIASLNRKFNEQVKKGLFNLNPGSEYNKTSAKCTNENSRKNSILLVDKISNKSKKSQSPNKKITVLIFNFNLDLIWKCS